MESYNIKMLDVKPEIVNYGFTKEGYEWGEGKCQWYSIFVPNTFRGKYTLYLCEGDICGVFQGMSVQDLDFDRFIDKLNFRTPEAVQWVKDMLNDLKDKGIINFEELK